MADWTLDGLLAQRVAQDGHGVTLTWGPSGDQARTWAEVGERSARLAAALADDGVGPGDRVAYLGLNDPTFFEVLFAAAQLGAVTVPVNWRLTAGEVEVIVADAAPSVLIVDADTAAVAADIAPPAELRRTITVGDDLDAWRDGHAPRPATRVGAADEVVLQLYTSGTTGLPKGVMLANANFARLLDIIPRWELEDGAVSLVALPLFHVGGVAWALVGMTAGARTVLVREFEPSATLALMEDQGVTNAFVVPAVLQFLCAVPGAADRDWSQLRTLLYGASPISDAVLTRAMAVFGCRFRQVYRLTETTGAITELGADDHDPHGPRAHLLRSAGRALPWVELAVVDPDGTPVPPDTVGEVVTRSPQNLVGYWHRPDDTAAVLDADGWFHTGDAGRLDADGYLYLTDRLKDVVVSGGENVYPAEVENVLMDHPQVAEVAVFGVPDERYGEGVRAEVVLAGGHADLDVDDLLASARQRLAGFKVPRSVGVVAALPRTPSGKVLKRELRAPHWAGHDRPIG